MLSRLRLPSGFNPYKPIENNCINSRAKFSSNTARAVIFTLIAQMRQVAPHDRGAETLIRSGYAKGPAPACRDNWMPLWNCLPWRRSCQPKTPQKISDGQRPPVAGNWSCPCFSAWGSKLLNQFARTGPAFGFTVNDGGMPHVPVRLVAGACWGISELFVQPSRIAQGLHAAHICRCGAKCGLRQKRAASAC